jgi:hypothetical protein
MHLRADYSCTGSSMHGWFWTAGTMVLAYGEIEEMVGGKPTRTVAIDFLIIRPG